MSRGKAWTRRELLLALHRYERLEFGKQHSRNPEVVALAKALGRTPGSVAMKLNNFTSLDPEERARDVRGLPGASALDRRIWAEFHQGTEATLEAEECWQEEFPPPRKARRPFGGKATESVTHQRVRRAQAYFRRLILSIYGGRCCITRLPVRGLLAASHIVPWAEDEANRLNPRNGLCLARTQDAAFDRGLVTLDAELRLVVGHRLRSLYRLPVVKANFAAYEGEPMQVPFRSPPDPRFLAWHREHRFQG